MIFFLRQSLLFLLIVVAGSIQAQYFLPTDSPQRHLLHYLYDSEPSLGVLENAQPVRAPRFYKQSDTLHSYFHTGESDGRISAVFSGPQAQPGVTFHGFGYFNIRWTDRVITGGQLHITNARNGEYLLGTNKTTFGMTGRIDRAWITYQHDNIGVTYGRDAVQQGPGRFSQLGVNGLLPPYDMIRLRLSKYHFHLRSFTAFFPPVRNVPHSQEYVQRYLTGRRLEYIHPSGRFTAAIGDLVLYTGVNRPVNPAISNPLIPMFPLMFEGMEWQSQDHLGDNENDQWLIDASYRVSLGKSRHKLYTEFILDDFQYAPEDRKDLDDALGITIGMGNVLPVSGPYTLHTQLELTALNTWVYNHPGQFTSWTYRNRPMGNREGGDVWEVHLRTDLWQGYRWSAGVQYDHIVKGEVTPTDRWDPLGTKEAAFPLGTVQTTRTLAIDFYYYTGQFRYIRPSVTYERVSNSGHQEGQEETNIEFRVELLWWI